MFRTLVAFGMVWAGAAAAQTPIDPNVYPTLNGGGLYDLNIASNQKGPPGTITVTSAQPEVAYSFKDMLANAHGYVEAGVSSTGGHNFSGGVSIPLLPGKADLDLAASTGQFGGYKIKGFGKTPVTTYNSYSAGLTLHPTDDTTAYIGVSGLQMHNAPYLYPYGYP